ncbi:23S ribosomal RNA methyltransferase Erm [Microbacterium gorillae]|uniref:23S ribosomal RNA methyltransferase Erm n=1 Tax=Microbacterium gorillae TaxID=1231063 RepID=UPI003D95FCD1
MRSLHGGRHELGQNFLIHTPTVRLIRDLVDRTEGTILELGAGDGALTAELLTLRRPLTAVEIDEHRARRLHDRFPRARVIHGDALRIRYHHAVVVGNIPFHITTPVLRRLLTSDGWHRAILLTQWEVARKRAGVGGATMMTAQTAPWFAFELHGRVPAHRFRPIPSVDGGILSVTRRGDPLVPVAERAPYERFVREVFTGRGHGIERILRARERASGVRAAVNAASIDPQALPRDLTPRQWAALWTRLRQG